MAATVKVPIGTVSNFWHGSTTKGAISNLVQFAGQKYFESLFGISPVVRKNRAAASTIKQRYRQKYFLIYMEMNGKVKV